MDMITIDNVREFFLEEEINNIRGQARSIRQNLEESTKEEIESVYKTFIDAVGLALRDSCDGKSDAST
jgi:hypothetical protein